VGERVKEKERSEGPGVNVFATLTSSPAARLATFVSSFLTLGGNMAMAAVRS
jgi:hypothetical protein